MRCTPDALRRRERPDAHGSNPCSARPAPAHLRACGIAVLGLLALLSACESSNPAARDAAPATSDAGRADDAGRWGDDALVGATDARPADASEADAGGTDAEGLDARASDATVPTDLGPAVDAGDAGGPVDAMPDLGPPAVLFQGDAPIYSPGPLAVRRVDLAEGEAGAPTALVAFVPDAGALAVPLVVFQHGFLMSGPWYSEVLQHLASHGFLVVAPQMYAADNLPFGKPSSVEEAEAATAVVRWLRGAETTFGVPVDRRAPGLAGHSRGGKVIWTQLSTEADLARAIAGIDPVDGTGGPLGGETRILDTELTFTAPALILGTGLGGQTGGPFAPACAPEGDNHTRFAERSPGEVWHSVATDYGHNDLLDPNPPGCLVCGVCAAGPMPAEFRRFVAGQLTAFFRGTLQDVPAALDLIDDPSAPVARTIESP